MTSTLALILLSLELNVLGTQNKRFWTHSLIKHIAKKIWPLNFHLIIRKKLIHKIKRHQKLIEALFFFLQPIINYWLRIKIENRFSGYILFFCSRFLALETWFCGSATAGSFWRRPRGTRHASKYRSRRETRQTIRFRPMTWPSRLITIRITSFRKKKKEEIRFLNDQI